mmetsp:Transcript_55787/g.130706  ORF Transcript_55787/g.130706 Transcript_55787/m.130706 type:complete len:125 (-) Transcript_55787:5-379(-)
MNVRIDHNPSCSKSRQMLNILREKGIEPKVIEYLQVQTPPTVAELDKICAALQCEPTHIVRDNEERFKELQLSLADPKSRDEWLEILSKDPILIQRPIVVVGDSAAVGRPFEKVLALLSPPLGQ